VAHTWRFGKRPSLLSKAGTGFGMSGKAGFHDDTLLDEPDMSGKSKMLQPCSSPGSALAANACLNALKTRRTHVCTGLSPICRTCEGI
jgi:hypothetical protein